MNFMANDKLIFLNDTMRSIFLFCTILVTNYSFSQTYRFFPEWKKGEERKVLITYESKDYLNDELKTNMFDTIKGCFRVKDENLNFFTMEFQIENPYMTTILKDIEWSNEHIELQELHYLYQVERNGLNWKLINCR
jgi:hypothetical protein